MNVQQAHLQKHPNYLGVFWVLAALTAVEVVVTYLPLPRIPILLPLALAKASLVAMYYMHLKFDQPVYRYIFLFGILMGLILIISFIFLFEAHLLDI